jgi:hypothetical protein
LRACLIVAVILVILFVIGFVALVALGRGFLSDLGLNANGTFRDCPIVSTAQLRTVLGPDTQASELTGLADATLGHALDRRVLANAQNCWVGTGSQGDTSGALGRIAKTTVSDGAAAFDSERTTATNGGYFAVDVPGVGDQALCTGMSNWPATGALVRAGNDLVYVSFMQGNRFGNDLQTAPSGVTYSPRSCQDAINIAELALK